MIYFFDNVNSRDSIYNFFLNQQDEKKKLLKEEFGFSSEYDNYITKYLPSIQDLNYDKFDILTYIKTQNFYFIISIHICNQRIDQVSLSNKA